MWDANLGDESQGGNLVFLIVNGMPRVPPHFSRDIGGRCYRDLTQRIWGFLLPSSAMENNELCALFLHLNPHRIKQWQRDVSGRTSEVNGFSFWHFSEMSPGVTLRITENVRGSSTGFWGCFWAVIDIELVLPYLWKAESLLLHPDEMLLTCFLE